MLASLYPLSYEILYDCVVGGTKDFFDVENPPSKGEAEDFELMRARMVSIHPKLAEDLGAGPLKSWAEKAQRFKEGVHLSPNDGSTTLLLRHCCRWLQERSVFTQSDLDTIERVLTHRHEIAHEIPTLLTEEGFEVQLSLIPAIAALIHRADLFWFRNDWMDTTSVPDEDFVSARLMLFQHILEAVAEQNPTANTRNPLY